MMITKKIRIEVTADDIRDGQPCDGDYCPVARALKRVLNDQPVKIGSLNALFYDTSSRATYKADLSRKIRKFIHEFDSLRNPEPMEATLEFQLLVFR